MNHRSAWNPYKQHPAIKVHAKMVIQIKHKPVPRHKGKKSTNLLLGFMTVWHCRLFEATSGIQTQNRNPNTIY